MIADVYVNYSLTNLRSLQDATHLLISIPPIPGIGDPVRSQLLVDVSSIDLNSI
jgi:hypothetical protein